MKKFLIFIGLIFYTILSLAQTQPPPASEVFKLSVISRNAQHLELTWHIREGYYLYRDKIKILTEETDKSALHLTLPTGVKKHDDFLGNYEVYSNQAQVQLTSDKPLASFKQLEIQYQGCSAAGFCYPPIKETLISTVSKQTASAAGTPDVITAPTSSTDNRAAALLQSDNLPLILFSFFGFGILLAFTPCVFPMIPILSGIIVGQGKMITTAKAFRLSLAYVLGMAATYAIAGVIAGLVGNHLQSTLQTPLALGLFSLLFVLLALSLFGFYEIQIPEKLQQRLHQLSHKQRSGSYIGVIIMGALSALIVSPCVSAPLIGALSYISQTGNSLLGGAALFALGLGSGLPLLLIGTSAGKLLPKSGHWMRTIKSVFGVLMLAVAIWLLERVLPGQIVLFLWALLLIVSSIYLGAIMPQGHTSWHRLFQGLGIALLIYGILILIGAAMGNTDPLCPLSSQQSNNEASIKNSNNAYFRRISSIAELEQYFKQARNEHKPIVLDFYADWCIACKHIEHKVLNQPMVRNALANAITLKVDITGLTSDEKALMKKYQIIAPPALLFFNANNQESPLYKHIGEINVEEMLRYVEKTS